MEITLPLAFTNSTGKFGTSFGVSQEMIDLRIQTLIQDSRLTMYNNPGISHGAEVSPEMHALRRKWIDALRSGVYKQGRNQLRPTNESMCCLGVLCDTNSPYGWSQEQAGSTPSMWFFIDPVTHHREISMPPASVLNRVGIPFKIAGDLAALNDSFGASFDDIARCLEGIFWMDGNE